jgi:hypothetical protein
MHSVIEDSLTQRDKKYLQRNNSFCQNKQSENVLMRTFFCEYPLRQILNMIHFYHGGYVRHSFSFLQEAIATSYSVAASCIVLSFTRLSEYTFLLVSYILDNSIVYSKYTWPLYDRKKQNEEKYN